MTKIDRSRHLELLRCPRARYLGYHFGGNGLSYSHKRPSLPLIVGGAIHKGLESLLGLAKQANPILWVDSSQAAVQLKAGIVNDACGAAQVEFECQIQGIEGLQGIADEHLPFTLAEQAALIEVLLRVYAVKALPLLLAEYEIVSVEQEYEWALSPNLTFMSRLDGLLRRRADGDLVVLSFKTDTGYDPQSKMEDHKMDLQGITEQAAVAHALGEHPQGVKMEFLVKGQWKEDKDRKGFRQQDTFLVHPWVKTGEVPNTGNLKWSYFWECRDAHIQVDAAGRKRPCPGGKTHGLGATYERINIWEVMDLKTWVDCLLSGIIQPEAGDPLAEDILYLPPPIYRTEAEIADRLSQVESLEAEVLDHLELAERYPEDLNRYFPQDVSSCNHNFGGQCQFHRMCWPFGAFGPALDNPAALGYTQRVPNHPSEHSLVQIEGVK